MLHEGQRSMCLVCVRLMLGVVRAAMCRVWHELSSSLNNSSQMFSKERMFCVCVCVCVCVWNTRSAMFIVPQLRVLASSWLIYASILPVAPLMGQSEPVGPHRKFLCAVADWGGCHIFVIMSIQTLSVVPSMICWQTNLLPRSVVRLHPRQIVWSWWFNQTESALL